MVNGGLSESGESVHLPNGEPVKLDFDASCLLCESHAEYQASQRTLKELQERLSAMVLQHGQAQGAQLDTGGTQANTSTQTSDNKG